MSDLKIRPEKVSLSSRQTQIFEVIDEKGSPVDNATWSVGKKDGEIDRKYVYRSPWLVFRGRTVVITAYAQGGGSATATVELTPIGFWTQFLGVYWFVCLFALAWFVTRYWNRLCPTCSVMVSPPAVTLSLRQAQVFSANVPVSWTPVDAANGLYQAPDTVPVTTKRIAILATSKADPDEQATADVFLTSDFSFSLQPPRTTVYAGESVDLTPALSGPAEVEWLKPAAGTIVEKSPSSGIREFRAPDKDKVSRPMTVMVLARAQAEGGREGIAGAHVTILPDRSGVYDDDCDSRTATGLLILIAAMGALGGLVHAMSSFTTFVGNRELLPSWIWWYVLRPFLGALVAVVVYLVFRARPGSADFALSSADCLSTAAFAALIGLFAEHATIKLKDIFDTLFTPRNPDPRRDAAGEVTPAKLEKLDPSTLTVGQTPLPPLKVIGTGFLDKSQVKVGDALRPANFVSATELTVSLTADDVKKAQTLSVTVFNKPSDGAASNSLTLTVQPPQDAAVEVKPATLEKLEPSTLKAGETPPLKVIGTGFLKDCQVKVGDALRQTTFVSATELTVSLTADDVKEPRTLTVTVFNKPDGAASNPLTLTVQ